MFKKLRRKKIVESYICVLNDLHELSEIVRSQKTEEGVEMQDAINLNSVIAKISEMKRVLTDISKAKYGFELHFVPESTQESE